MSALSASVDRLAARLERIARAEASHRLLSGLLESVIAERGRLQTEVHRLLDVLTDQTDALVAVARSPFAQPVRRRLLEAAASD